MRRLVPCAMGERVVSAAGNRNPSGQTCNRDWLRAVHAQEVYGIFRNTVNFPNVEVVDFLGENRLDFRGTGLHQFGKCCMVWLYRRRARQRLTDFDSAKGNAVGDGFTHGVRAHQGLSTTGLFGLCCRLADCIFLLGELHACGLQLVLDLGHIGGFDIGCGRLCILRKRHLPLRSGEANRCV